MRGALLSLNWLSLEERRVPSAGAFKACENFIIERLELDANLGFPKFDCGVVRELLLLVIFVLKNEGLCLALDVFVLPCPVAAALDACS